MRVNKFPECVILIVQKRMEERKRCVNCRGAIQNRSGTLAGPWQKCAASGRQAEPPISANLSEISRSDCGAAFRPSHRDSSRCSALRSEEILPNEKCAALTNND